MCPKGLCVNNWKPVRAHHCKVCNACTLRMDHHCPWTVNCVGINSHKAFYLTSVYWAVIIITEATISTIIGIKAGFPIGFMPIGFIPL